MKNNSEVATETVKYLTLFTASLDKNQIYFLVKKNSSTHYMCTDSRRFIAAHWNKEFHMCCSGGNILTICFCLPSVFFTNSVLVWISQLQMVFPRPKNTGITASFHMSKLVTAEGCKVFSLALGALHNDWVGLSPCLPLNRRLNWLGLGYLAWQRVGLLLQYGSSWNVYFMHNL